MWIFVASASACPISETIPVALGDGASIVADGPIRFGLVGGFAWAEPATETDLRASDLAFLVLAGDAVSRGTRSEYRALSDRLDPLPIVPLPGAGEARRDARLRRYATTFSGIGVEGIGRAVPWWAFDVRTDGITWRFVVLDADPDRPGISFQDQLAWVPKVIARGDEQLILLLNRPIRSLSSSWEPGDSAGAALLHDLVRRHSGPTRLALVAAGGAPTPEFLLPGGIWGEGWLGAGRADGPSDTLLRARSALALEPGLDQALSRWFSSDGLPAPAATDDYRIDAWPVEGWWRITLDGSGLTVILRGCRAGCSDVYAVRWTRIEGWRYTGL